MAREGDAFHCMGPSWKLVDYNEPPKLVLLTHFDQEHHT